VAAVRWMGGSDPKLFANDLGADWQKLAHALFLFLHGGAGGRACGCACGCVVF
jgi:hypothetical protein